MSIYGGDSYKHRIRDDADYSHHVDYAHNNPVKPGLVRRVCDWAHSMFHRFGLYRPDQIDPGLATTHIGFLESEQ